jgi:hypothetical protein
MRKGEGSGVRILKDCSQWADTVVSWQVLLMLDCIAGMLRRFLEGADERLP